MEKENQRPAVAVGVMIFNKEGKVLIGKRRKTTSHGPGEYCFPGGHIESGESFKETAFRETSEEAGIIINNLKFLCVTNIDRYKNHQVVLIGMTADWESGEPRSFPEENVGDWKWEDLDNLPSPLFSPTELMIKSYQSGQNYFDLR